MVPRLASPGGGCPGSHAGSAAQTLAKDEDISIRPREKLPCLLENTRPLCVVRPPGRTREARRRRGGGGSVDLQQIESEAARDDLARRLEEGYEQELLRKAMDAVQARVEPRTWEAFQLTALDGLSGAEAARRLGMSIAGVFKARSRVQQLLRSAVANTEEND